MTRTPTAEEVLSLFQVIYDTGEVCEPFQAFYDAFKQWQAAQGAVTCEWFMDRFGVLYVVCERGDIVFRPTHGTVGLILDDETEEAELVNPTRGDIERLVKLLGGEV